MNDNALLGMLKAAHQQFLKQCEDMDRVTGADAVQRFYEARYFDALMGKVSVRAKALGFEQSADYAAHKSFAGFRKALRMQERYWRDAMLVTFTPVGSKISEQTLAAAFNKMADPVLKKAYMQIQEFLNAEQNPEHAKITAEEKSPSLLGQLTHLINEAVTPSQPAIQPA